MHHLTTGELWAGLLVAIGAVIFIAGGYCLHLKKVVEDIIRKEKARLRAWAAKYAEQLAREGLRFSCMHGVQLPLSRRG